MDTESISIGPDDSVVIVEAEAESLKRRISVCSESKRKSFDDFIELGWYTLFICIAAEFNILCQGSNMFFMVYAGAAPKIVGCGNAHQNSSVTNWCAELPNIRSNGECEPELSYQFYSVNVEFDRLCWEGNAVKYSISVQMIGVLIGAAMFGQISDSFGRKFTIVICLVGSIVSGFITSYAGSLLTFTIWRTVVGFFTGGSLVVFHVFTLEHIPKRHRAWITSLITWSPNVIVNAGVAYLAHDWRTLSKVISLLALPGLAMYLFASESPRWYLQKGKFEDAKNTIKRIRAINRSEDSIKVTEELNAVIEMEIERSKTVTSRQHYIYHLFYTKKLTLYTIVIGFGFSAFSMINYGLMFNFGALSGSIFINNAFFGAFRWTMNIIYGLLDYFIKPFGRKIAQFSATSFIALSLFTAFLIHALGVMSSYGVLLRCATLCAAALCSQGYITKSLTTLEKYPTAIRNLANSFMGTMSRLGSIFSPQLFILSTYWSALPYLILTAVAVTDLIAFQCFIPETKGKPMTDYLPVKEKKLKGGQKA